jgi:hypothetical protein
VGATAPGAATTARAAPGPAPATTARVAAGPPAPASTTVAAAAVTAPGAPAPAPPAPVAPRRWLGPALGVAGLVALAGAAALVLRRPTPAALTTPAPEPSAAPAAGTPVPGTLPSSAPAATAPAPAVTPAVERRPPAPDPRAAVPAAPRLSPERAMEVEGLLAEAETAFKAQQHRVALEFYEQALKVDPANERARVGRDLCAGALAQAPAVAARPPRTFVAGRTQHSGTAAAPAGPAGFESSAGVAVRRVDQAAAAPGKLLFEVEPAAVRPGDAYTVKVFMVNEGAAALRLADATVSTVADGRTSSGAVALLAREAPPRQRTLIVSAPGQWRAETESWSLAVTVRTAGGDTYRNELVWK